MAQLQTANQYQLVPDVNSAIGTGLNVYNTIQSNRRQDEELGLKKQISDSQSQKLQAEQDRLAKMQQLAQIAMGQPSPNSNPLTVGGQFGGSTVAPSQQSQFGATPTLATPQITPDQAMQQMLALDPEMGKKMLDNIGVFTQFQADDAAKDAAYIRQLPESQQAAAIQARAQKIQARGGNPADTLQLLDMPYEQRNKILMATQHAALSAKDSLAISDPKQDLTSTQKDLIAAGYQPGTPEFQRAVMQQMNKPTGTNVVVNTGEGQMNVMLKKEAEKEGQIWADRLGKTLEAGDKAEETIAVVEQMKAIVNAPSGAFEQSKMKLSAMARGVGLDALADQISAVTEQGQAYNALTGKLVQSMLNAAAGPQTDSDAARVREIVPTITDEKASQSFKLRSVEAFANRDKEKADFIRNKKIEAQSAGGFYSTAQAEADWKKYTKEAPILGDVAVGTAKLPMFFNEFKAEILRNNPNASIEKINALWKKQTGAK